jgi:hypothetical protein
MTSIQITGPRAADATAQVDADGTVTITIPDRPALPAVAGRVESAPAAPLRVGLHPTPAEYGTWLPRLPTPWFTRVFNPPGKGLPPWGGKAVMDLPEQTIRHVSFKDRVPPAGIRAFLDSIPVSVPAVWLTWFHEGDIDWAHDVAGYTNYWRMLRAACDDHPNRPKVTLVNVHTQYASRLKRSAFNWRAFMLPDVADVDGWDCYRPQTPDVYEAPEALLGLPLTARREFSVRVHITEFGTHPASWDTDGAAQAQWYRESLAVMAAAGVEAVGLWCNIDGKLEYRPKKPAVLEEWRRLMVQYNTPAAD